MFLGRRMQSLFAMLCFHEAWLVMASHCQQNTFARKASGKIDMCWEANSWISLCSCKLKLRGPGINLSLHLLSNLHPYFSDVSSFSWRFLKSLRRFRVFTIFSQLKMARGGHFLFGSNAAAWDKQFVWRRDKNGRTPRTWWDGFKDIVSNRAPDIYVTRKHDRSRTKPDQRGNWQVLHSYRCDASTLTSHQGMAMIAPRLKHESFVKLIMGHTMRVGEINSMNLKQENILSGNSTTTMPMNLEESLLFSQQKRMTPWPDIQTEGRNPTGALLTQR